MTAHMIELAATAPQPWRNGGGVTRELLAWPPGTGSDWQLRVSVADIERDGPFSPYPGVQRCFAVLEGVGVVLAFADRELTLTTGSEPLTFDGADAPDCRLMAGPTRDLNLMVRGGAGRATMRTAAGDGCTCASPSPWRGLFTTGPLRLDVGSGALLALPASSLAWCESPAGPWRLGRVAGQPMPRAWWLTLDVSDA